MWDQKAQREREIADKDKVVQKWPSFSIFSDAKWEILYQLKDNSFNWNQVYRNIKAHIQDQIGLMQNPATFIN